MGDGPEEEETKTWGGGWAGGWEWGVVVQPGSQPAVCGKALTNDLWSRRLSVDWEVEGRRGAESCEGEKTLG